MTREEFVNMSNEEAIEVIKQDIPCEHDTDLIEALEMAIKALEQGLVMDKIRAEIETKYGQCDICEYFENYDYEENDISEYRPTGNIADILQIIDKYKGDKK